ncbi:hypothetical protein ACLB1R_16140 [Escherichia coli]
MKSLSRAVELPEILLNALLSVNPFAVKNYGADISHSKTINLAYERHSTHLFIYTKTEYEALFRQCGFSTLTSVPGVMVLMENSATRLKRYAESLKKFASREQDWLHCDERQSLYEGSPLSDSTGWRQCDWLHLF